MCCSMCGRFDHSLSKRHSFYLPGKLKISSSAIKHFCGTSKTQWHSFYWIKGTSASNLHMIFSLFIVQSGDVNQLKAAFFISTPFSTTVFNVFQNIIRASSFRTVLVFSNIPPVMHSIFEYHVADEEMKAFDSYRMQILQWLEIKVLFYINSLLSVMII